MEYVWKKRDGCKTVRDVIERNTGMKADEFLHPEKNPFVANLKEAADFFKKAAKEVPLVTVMADYDCDGVMSALILERFLAEFAKAEKLSYRIRIRFPKRFSEGYGLSMNVVNETEEGLLITVDNGIAAVSQIREAKKKGLKVLVIDHHLPPKDGILPPADVILDPHAQEGSAFADYCGAGLAFRFAQKAMPSLPAAVKKKLCVFASIATVADMVPLYGDNRNLVKEGLALINKGQVTFGMQVLLDLLRLRPLDASGFCSLIDEETCGYSIGPLVNAAGRMEDDGPEMVFLLLREDADMGCPVSGEKLKELKEKAQALISFNEARKAAVDACMEHVRRDMARRDLADERFLVILCEDSHEGINGLIASMLVEEYRRPAVVLCRSAKDPSVLKGSGRTFSDIHIRHVLDEASGFLIGYGGHAGAAGLSLHEKDLNAFAACAGASLAGYDFEKDKNVRWYDLSVRAADVPDLLPEVLRYAPYGEGNPKPVFAVTGYELAPSGGQFIRLFGQKAEHIRLFGRCLPATGFYLAKQYQQMQKPKKMELLGSLKEECFRKKKFAEIQFTDFHAESFGTAPEPYRNLEDVVDF